MLILVTSDRIYMYSTRIRLISLFIAFSPHLGTCMERKCAKKIDNNNNYYVTSQFGFQSHSIFITYVAICIVIIIFKVLDSLILLIWIPIPLQDGVKTHEFLAKYRFTVVKYCNSHLHAWCIFTWCKITGIWLDKKDSAKVAAIICATARGIIDSATWTKAPRSASNVPAGW